MKELITYHVAEEALGQFIATWSTQAVTSLNRHGIGVVGAWIVEGTTQVIAILEFFDNEQLESANESAASLLPGITKMERRPLTSAMEDPRFARTVMEEDPTLS